MKFRRLIPFLVGLLLTLTACEQNGIYTFRFVAQGDFQIPAGVSESATILLLDGTVKIADGGTLRGDLYQVLGDTMVAGTIEGDLIHLSGNLVLEPTARILGNFQTAGQDSRLSFRVVPAGIPEKAGAWLLYSE